MVYIESDKQHKDVLDFYKKFNTKQLEIETDDTFVYPIIPISMAIRYKVLIDELMLHPLVLKNRKFFENVITISSKKDLIKIITSVIERELLTENGEKNFMGEKNLNKLIKAHKRLTNANKTVNGDKSTDRPA